MAKTFKTSGIFKLKFGGGLHSRASEEDIDPRECSDGENFTLDADNQQFRPRKPFDLIGTVPNGSEIRGAGTLLKSDGTVSTLVQGGNTMYEWDGLSGFTNIGTVSSTSKLRGRIEHNWQLTDKVLFTDVANVDPVKEWDGTTFQNVTFTDEDGYNFGTFRSRYCYVSNERAVFANVHSNGTDSSHLIVGSKRGDYTNITVANRPASSLSAQDPFFIVQPDNRYINGIIEAFGQTVISSEKGSMYKMTGSDATDFSISPLYTQSGATGDEAVQLVNNDVVYGIQGKIKSLKGVDTFGDVESSDLSFWIADEVEDFDDWLVATNRRLERTYFHPVGQSVIYVLHHALVGSEVSPWSKWTTKHSMSFNPTFMMNVLDPLDGLEYVIMGDSSGRVYRMEGTGSGDGGTTAIAAFRTSKLFSGQSEGKIYDNEGYIRYRRNAAVTATILFRFYGDHVLSNSVSLSIPAPDISAVYGTTAFYGTQYFYGSGEQVIARQPFKIPGGSNDFTVKVSVEDVDEFTINEIGIRYEENN